MARVVVIGHPLAALENRLAFSGWKQHQVTLILPAVWHARSLGHGYHTPKSQESEATSQGIAGIYALRTLFSGRNSFFLWVGISRLLHRLQPDIVYCWEEPWCLSTWQIKRLTQHLGIPLLFYSAENRPKSLPWPFSILLRSTFAAAEACIAPTPEIESRIRSWGFSKRIFNIPLWITPRRQLAVSGHIHCLVFVGRLIPLKRVHLLVESLSLLPGYTLRIIGNGPERGRLNNLARTHGVKDRVDFRGHVNNASLASALEGASLLILPTAENLKQAEQFGKAAVEGVACGLPVLTSRTGNLTALSFQFSTLIAKDVDTPLQMATAILDVFRHYPDATALGFAKVLAEESYGPIAAARKFESAITALLGKPSV